VPLDEDAVAPASSTSARAAPKLPPPKGLLVSRKRVVEAANAGHRPSATPVAATSYRPAGVALSGVSATGAGLVDGDVLTRIAGAPATSPGVVVGAVTGALRHKAPSISGEVWRDTQRIVVTVELPDIEPPTP
jgi:S1-C subfamily serine protease